MSDSVVTVVALRLQYVLQHSDNPNPTQSDLKE